MAMKKINKVARTLKKLFGVDHRNYINSAIIVAAGSGSRMNSPDGTTKQLMEIDGLPVIVRTVTELKNVRISTRYTRRPQGMSFRIPSVMKDLEFSKSPYCRRRRVAQNPCFTDLRRSVKRGFCNDTRRCALYDHI